MDDDAGPPDLQGQPDPDPDVLDHGSGAYEPVVEISVGRRKTGKTWNIRARTRELLDSGADYAFAHDPWGAYPEDGLLLGQRGEGWAVLNDPGEWRGECVASFRSCQPEAVADLARALSSQGKRVILIVDEMDMICNQHRWKSEAARDAVHYGRHLNMCFLGSARRFSSVHADVISIADTVYLHKLTGPRERALIASQWGDEIAAMVAELPKPPSDRPHYLTIRDDEIEAALESSGAEIEGDDGDRVAPDELGDVTEEPPDERTDRVRR